MQDGREILPPAPAMIQPAVRPAEQRPAGRGSGAQSHTVAVEKHTEKE